MPQRRPGRLPRILNPKLMYLLITYDVSTTDPEGAKRLRRVARICTNYGQRVQNSVFECLVSPAQRVVLEAALIDTIDLECDSIRIYHLGSNYQSKITTIGKTRGVDPEGILFI